MMVKRITTFSFFAQFIKQKLIGCPQKVSIKLQPAIIIFFLFIICQTSYAQFDQSGWTLGAQGGKGWVNPAYSVNRSGTLSYYKDKYSYLHFDTRIFSVSDNVYFTCDGSAIGDMLIVIVQAISKMSKDEEITKGSAKIGGGALKNIESNAGPNISGTGADWTFLQLGLGFGADGLYLGPDFEIGGIGVTTNNNSGGNVLTDSYQATFWTLGGALSTAQDGYRASLRMGKLYTENRLGFSTVIELDKSLGDHFYVGTYFKSRRIGKYKDEIEVPGDDTKIKARTIGLKCGFWIPL